MLDDQEVKKPLRVAVWLAETTVLLAMTEYVRSLLKKYFRRSTQQQQKKKEKKALYFLITPYSHFWDQPSHQSYLDH